MNTARWQRLCVSLRQWNALDLDVKDLDDHLDVTDIFKEKKKKKCIPVINALIYFNLFYCNISLLIIHLSANETLIVIQKFRLIRSTSFGFAQITIHDPPFS